MGLSGHVRSIQEQDLSKLAAAGVELLTPMPREGSIPDSLPSYLGRAAGSQSVHVHFEWLGAEDQGDNARKHWLDLIDLSQSVHDDEWLQSVVQTVDLNDVCAIAVTPAVSFTQHISASLNPALEVERYAAGVARLLLRAEQLHVKIIGLRAQDVVVNEFGQLQLSARCEMTRAVSRKRTEYLDAGALFEQWLADVADSIPAVQSSTAVLLGICHAVLRGEQSRGGLGELILALEKARRGSASGSVGIPGNKSASPTERTWVRPAPKRRSYKVPVLAGAGGAVALLLAAGYFLSVGAGNLQDGSATRAAVPAAGADVVGADPAPAVLPSSGLSTTTTSEEFDVQDTVTTLLTERLYLLELGTKDQAEPNDSESDVDGAQNLKFESIFVAGSPAEQQERARLIQLAEAGIVITNTSLTDVTVLESPAAESSLEQPVLVHLEYGFSYDVEQHGVKETKMETETVHIGLENVEGDYRIASVEEAA